MGPGRTGEPQANQRLTVAQAAVSLGITEGAVRSRIKRGTLTTTKVGGSVFVLLGGGSSATYHSPDHGEPTAQPGLVEELRDRVASLERQLERHGDETERLHQIIGGLAQANAEQARTIRAIEAPSSEEPAEAAETVGEEPEAAEPRSDREGSEILQDEPTDAPGSPEQGTVGGGGVPPEPQAGARRPWWRRVFGS